MNNALGRKIALVAILTGLFTSDGSAQVSAGGGAFNGPGTGIQKFGQAFTQNPGLTCTASTGRAGYILVLQATTGMALEVAGVAAMGSITVPGADAVARRGVGAVELSISGLFNQSNQTFGSGGSILAQYALDTGAASSMPTSAAAAEALFDKVFGAAARDGVTFTRSRKTQSGQILGYWGTVNETLPSSLGGQSATVTRGVVLFQGRVIALDTVGTGSWRAYAY
jgi:hypothetical protein